MSGKKWVYAPMAVLLVVPLLVACGGAGSSSSSIEAAAKAWMEAVAEGDARAAVSLTCESLRDDVQESIDYFGPMNWDLSRLQYSVSNVKADTAEVKVAGMIRDENLRRDLDVVDVLNDDPLPMAKENGQWTVCSSW